jgi:hypothetical protein
MTFCRLIACAEVVNRAPAPTKGAVALGLTSHPRTTGIGQISHGEPASDDVDRQLDRPRALGLLIDASRGHRRMAFPASAAV